MIAEPQATTGSRLGAALEMPAPNPSQQGGRFVAHQWNAELVTTVLDVLEGFFGALPSKEDVRLLSRREVEELGDLAVESAEARLLETINSDGLTYPGGWLGRHWDEPVFRRDLSLELLYQPRLLVHDPIADYFFRDVQAIPDARPLRTARGVTVHAGPREWAAQLLYVNEREDFETVRSRLAYTIDCIVDLAPLLQEGVVVALPQWPTIVARRRHIETSARHDVRDPAMGAVAASASLEGGQLPVWDNLRGMHVTVSDPWVSSDQPWQWHPEFLYLAKTLAVADAAGATYAPTTEDELRLLQAKAGKAASAVTRDHIRPELLREVGRIFIPDLQLSPATAVAMRRSDDSFEDWRRLIRTIEHEARGDTGDELRQYVEDTLIPQAAKVRNSVDRSPSLGDAAWGGLTAVVSGVVSQGGHGLGLTALGGLGAGVLSWLWKAYGPRDQLTGAEAVMASLVRTARPS